MRKHKNDNRVRDMIYIASPYTNSDKAIVQKNYDDVTKYVAYLTSKNKIVLSPITYGHVLANTIPMPTDWVFWETFCISFLSKCDKMYVLMLDGWDKSVGVAGEIKFAEEHNIEIIYVDPETIDYE